MKSQKDVNKRMDEDEDVNLSSILSSIKKNNNPYQIPDGYFSKMEDQIISRIQTKEKNSFSIIFKFFRRPVVSVPLGISLALLAILFITKKPSVEKRVGVPQMSQEELINTNIFMDMDEDLLLETFYSSNASPSLLSDDAAFYKEAEQYLIDHKIDVNLIMNEL